MHFAHLFQTLGIISIICLCITINFHKRIHTRITIPSDDIPQPLFHICYLVFLTEYLPLQFLSAFPLKYTGAEQ